MTGAAYVPGTWLGIVRSRTAVILGPDTPPALADTVWTLLAGRPEVYDVLQAITGSAGGNLSRIPSFGLLDFTGPLRVFLRGGLELTVDSPDGPVELHGRDVTTWNERSFAVAETCSLAIPGAGEPDGQTLRLGEGMVLLQSMVLAAGNGQAVLDAAAALAPAEAGAPVPAAVAVDSAGTAQVLPDAPAGGDEGPTGTEGAGEPGEATIAPDHVSVETVYAVIDDDGAVLDAAPLDGDVDLPGVEPEPSLSGAAASAEEPEAAAAPALDLTSSYDHLWERTVIRNIEDAAVREEPDGGEPAPASAPALEAPAPQVALEPAGTGEPAAEEPKPAPGLLIDSVPWRTGGAPVPSAPTPLPPSSLANPGQFTPPPGPEAPAGQTASGQGPGAAGFDADHDGQTVMKSSLAQAPAGPSMPAAAGADPADGPLVLARVCGQGHANPPTRAACSACGAALPEDAVQVPRPRLGRMRLSTGELLDLDQSLVIGRQPSVSRVQGGTMPRLVQVPSPAGDISRSHVEVRLEGWHVMLCDLKATNGTVLVRGGQPPRRLAQNEMAILLDGDIAELGDNISLRFEEIP